MPKEKAANWGEKETFALIALWGENQERLKEMRDHKLVYEKISDSLNALGYFRTANQVQNKIKDLKKVYGKHKPGPTGDSPSDWIYFKQIHEILHTSPSMNEELCVIEEAGLPEDQAAQPSLDSDEIETAPNNDKQKSNENLGDQFVTPGRKVGQSRHMRIKRRRVAGFQEEALEILKANAEESKKVQETICGALNSSVQAMTAMTQAFTQIAAQFPGPHPAPSNYAPFSYAAYFPHQNPQTSTMKAAEPSSVVFHTTLD